MTEKLVTAKAGRFLGKGFKDEDVVRTSPLGSRIEIFFDTPIGFPDEHRDEIHAIRSAGPNDVIVMYINTPGGYLNTTMSIINALMLTEADVIAVCEGMIASAGTLIACAANNIQVMPHTQFMVHSAAGGADGILRNTAQYALFGKEQTERFMRDVYQDFLTEEEFEKVFNGLELWFGDDELVERFKLRAEKRNARVGALDSDTE